jgi:hypothetical protein
MLNHQTHKYISTNADAELGDSLQQLSISPRHRTRQHQDPPLTYTELQLLLQAEKINCSSLSSRCEELKAMAVAAAGRHENAMKTQAQKLQQAKQTIASLRLDLQAEKEEVVAGIQAHKKVRHACALTQADRIFNIHTSLGDPRLDQLKINQAGQGIRCMPTQTQM